MSATAIDYPGTELELFAHATNWKDYALRKLRPFIRGDVAEVGAGIGSTTISLSRADGVASWTAIEPDSDMAQRLSATLPERAFPVSAQSGTLADLPADADFDTILYIDVLEHIEADAAELVEAFRRLRPGGNIVVLCPAYQMLFSPFDKAIGHYRRYTKTTLRRVAPEGARERAAFYLDVVGLCASLLNAVLLRQKQPTHGQIRLWDKVMVPLSRIFDPLLGSIAGKSVVVIWTRD